MASGARAGATAAAVTAETEVPTWLLEARLMRKRTPDFSSSSSSIDSRDATISIISFSSFKFIRINEQYSRSGGSLNFPGCLFQFVAGAAKLVLRSGQQDQIVFGGYASGNHDGLFGDNDVFDEASGSRIFRGAAGDVKQC